MTGKSTGPLAPGAPPDTFWAIGMRRQIVAVVPSEGVVAVRLGGAPPDGVEFDQTSFTEGVLAALTDR